jgi:hypothetical protein
MLVTAEVDRRDGEKGVDDDAIYAMDDRAFNKFVREMLDKPAKNKKEEANTND